MSGIALQHYFLCARIIGTFKGANVWPGSGGGDAVFMVADNHYVPLLKEHWALVRSVYDAVRFLPISV
jgi:hypothetical protein